MRVSVDGGRSWRECSKVHLAWDAEGDEGRVLLGAVATGSGVDIGVYAGHGNVDRVAGDSATVQEMVDDLQANHAG